MAKWNILTICCVVHRVSYRRLKNVNFLNHIYGKPLISFESSQQSRMRTFKQILSNSHEKCFKTKVKVMKFQVF